MCLSILLVLLAALAPTIPAQAPDPVKKELQALQGTWELVVFENDRQVFEKRGIEKEFDKDAPVRILHIDGEKLRLGKGERAKPYTLRKGGKPKSGTYSVDPSVSPGRMAISTGSEGGLFGGVMTFEGIYRLKGDRLEICVVWSDHSELPKDFSVEKGNGWCWLLVYERVAKKDGM
jgi:uncharacterized protein (TIGR03067 family)